MSSGPAERSRRPPSPAFCRGRSKKNKNTLGVFLFLLWPRAGAQRGFSFPCLSPGPQQKKKKHTHPGWCFFFCSGPVPAPNGASPSPAIRRGRSKKNKSPWVVFFFLLWPRAGAQRGFFFPCLSPWPEQKKNNTLGGVFFLALAPCRRPTELLLPLPSAAVKKNTHPGWCLFFCSGPVPAPNGASPSPAFLRGRSKKKTPWVFALAPCRRPTGLLLPLPCPGAGAKKTPWLGVFFIFCSGPVPAPKAGSKKKTPWVVFFFFALAPCRRPTGLLLPLPFPGAGAKKKNTLGGVFFFCSGPVPAPKAGAKKNTLGGVYFLLWPRAGAQRSFSFPCLSPGPEQKKNTHPGWCFFFCSGPVPAPNEASPSPAFPRGRSKKTTPWVVFFFLLWPRAGAQGRSKKKHPVFFFCSGPVPAPNGASPSPAFPGGRSQKKNTLGGVFFFALAPCRRPTELLLPLPSAAVKKTHTLGGVYFFALAPCRRPTALLLPLPFSGAGAKKKHPGFLLWPRAGAQRGFSFPCLSPGPEQRKTPWVFFFYFALAPCRRPRPDQKKNTLGGVFFCSGPVPAPNEASPSPAFPRGRSKKKKHPGWCFFFALAPCRRPRPEQKKSPWVVFIFCSGPVPAPNEASPSPAFPRGRRKKKTHPGWCFFFCSGPVPAPNEASPSPAFPRGRSKKKSPWVVFVFLLWPRAGAQGRSKKQHPGWCFFFALAPCRRPTKLLLPLPLAPGPEQKKNTLGGVFFFLLWPRAGAQGRSKKTKHPGWCFFFALAPCRRPTGLLLPLPFPGAGAKKKKTTPWVVFFFCSGPAEAPNGLLLPLPFPGAGEKKQHPGWCFFFCSGPVPAPKAGAKKKTPWVVFFFLLWPRAGAQRGFSFPCLSPGPEQKKKNNTLGGVFFFALAPPRRPTERNKKKNFAHPGRQQKIF